MATKDEIRDVLKLFHAKAEIFGLVYLDRREKNMKTLAELCITAKYRDNIVKQLSVKDFYKGPEPNRLNDLGDMWVFGKTINSKEVYIKVTLGRTNSQAVCISFHIAEHPIKYPFKEEKI